MSSSHFQHTSTSIPSADVQARTLLPTAAKGGRSTKKSRVCSQNRALQQHSFTKCTRTTGYPINNTGIFVNSPSLNDCVLMTLHLFVRPIYSVQVWNGERMVQRVEIVVLHELSCTRFMSLLVTHSTALPSLLLLHPSPLPNLPDFIHFSLSPY